MNFAGARQPNPNDWDDGWEGEEPPDDFTGDVTDNDPSEEILPSPRVPLHVARALVKKLDTTDGVYHLAWWRGDFYRWNRAAWQIEEPAAVRRWLYLATEHARYIADPKKPPALWAPGPATVNNVLDAMATAILQRTATLEPDSAIACINGVYDLDSDTLVRHTPARFNLRSLPYRYDKDARCPEWDKFIGDVLGHDQEAQLFLAEWFGYVISGRTDLQKIASLVGPPRCGKGTIGRVLEAVLGSESVASPSIERLASNFGEQPLIGKALAILADVRWNGRGAGEAVPVLLGISGEDPRDVDRKNREAWHGKLDVRFLLMSNDTPTFSDVSGALANRMIHVQFTETFLGREDPGLTDRLKTELPGILNWSLAGLRRLTARGSFTTPASSRDLHAEVLRIASPETAFVDDACTIDPAAATPLDDLYREYGKWCTREGRDHPLTKPMFSRNVQGAFRGKVTVERRTQPDGTKARLIVGLKLQ